jgi:hypothetical protein
MINGNFERYNQLLKDLGPEGLNEFLNREMTVRDLKQMGHEISGENVDTKVRGLGDFWSQDRSGIFPEPQWQF